MFNRMKNALYNVVGGLEPFPAIRDNVEGGGTDGRPPLKFRYTRPLFLQLTTDDEVQVSADHIIRPIIVPRDITKLPWNSGYAEAINAGKSLRNEDQGTCVRGVLYPSIVKEPSTSNIPGQPIQLQSPVIDTAPGTKSPKSKSGSMKKEEEVGEEASEKNIPAETAAPESNSEVKSTNPSGDDSKFATPPSSPEKQQQQQHNSLGSHTIPWVYFALFDGHAGSGVAVAASNTLHKLIQERLQEVSDLLLLPTEALNVKTRTHSQYSGGNDKLITADSLISGALEAAFWDMDNMIAEDKKVFTMTGGCTALVAVFILGKLYVANAGDSRSVLCRGTKVIPMSYDFTPETERNRIRKLGLLRPELLGGEFTHLEFPRRPVRKDLGKKVLYRNAYMTGWCYKTITYEDLKFPLIYGEGKRSRVLATIGVTRGFGDHDLKALNTDINIKPFLTAEPEVIIFDLMAEDLTDSDVLVMGTDGLWDVTLNEKAAEVVQKSLDHFPANDSQRYKYRYTSAAQDLVMHARGKLRERNWLTAEDKLATIDDISVFVIPLRHYKAEHIQWLTLQESAKATVKTTTEEVKHV